MNETIVTHELRFQSLFDPGRAMTFPCDDRGNVDLDMLGKHALANYLFARTSIGRDFAIPAVARCEAH